MISMRLLKRLPVIAFACCILPAVFTGSLVSSCAPIEDACADTLVDNSDIMNRVFVTFQNSGTGNFASPSDLGITSIRNLEADITKFESDGYFGQPFGPNVSLSLPLNLDRNTTTYVLSRGNGQGRKDTLRFDNYFPTADFVVEKCGYEVNTQAVGSIKSTFNGFYYSGEFNDSLNINFLTFQF